MRRNNFVRMVVLIAALAFAAAPAAFAQSKPAAKPAAKPEAKAAMKAPQGMMEGSWFLVMSPHTEAQCLAALDEIGAEGAGKLAQWDWGCKSGDHTGYLRVRAASAKEALMAVPADLRGEAKAVALSKFTEADLKAMHSAMPKH